MNFFLISIIAICSPFLVFYCVKFGRYGWLQANDLFRQKSQEKAERPDPLDPRFR